MQVACQDVVKLSSGAFVPLQLSINSGGAGITSLNNLSILPFLFFNPTAGYCLALHAKAALVRSRGAECHPLSFVLQWSKCEGSSTIASKLNQINQAAKSSQKQCSQVVSHSPASVGICEVQCMGCPPTDQESVLLASRKQNTRARAPPLTPALSAV